jgi:predicted RNA-binding Zn-ribbon protein involved in translation (DUF1610 family)
MTAAYRVVVADRKDVEVVTIVCPECGAELSLKIATARLPEYCPSCQLVFRIPIPEALSALGRFQRAAATAEETWGKPIFKFSIKQAD